MSQKFTLPSRIFFTGFMATGKTRLAELTAAALGYRYLDTDSLVVRKTEREISQIFAEDGEAYFRQLELQVLTEISHEDKVVVSLGGGTLTQDAAASIVLQSGFLIGLWADPETILERVNRHDDRPLLSGLSNEEKLAKIKSMLKEREHIYAKARFQFKSSNDIPHHTLVHSIISRLELECIEPVRVELGARSYNIYIDEDLSEQLEAALEQSGAPKQCIIITDTNLREAQRDFLRVMYRQLGKCRIFYFRPGEEEKNLGSINRLLTFLIKYKFDRKTTLVAFGGGVVGDMVGFAAAIFLRGVPFIQVPTTMLAMVDSSVGGKTGVNHRFGKNLVGAFHQPRSVIISISVLKTLSETEYLSGLAEVIKYACIWDASFFDYLLEHRDAILARDPNHLKSIVHRCCNIKAEVVGKDEKETDLRAILNYGHTFGHALESLSHYQGLPHGHGVALGMLVAGRLSTLLGMWSSEQEQRQLDLISAYHLPTKYKVDREYAWDIMGNDKKVDDGNRVFILPLKIGEVRKVKNPDQALVHQAWDAIDPPVGDNT